ncbi:MAG: VCBS repeat-containing protein, partial [Candidatus Marinimicrobia bacterium]|nr:VCBS repeat-containing protein [Candidatus Neomarinimicrobiota bacterium]
MNLPRRNVFIVLFLLYTIKTSFAQIVSTNPSMNELNVAKNTNISVTFSQDMDSSTINANTFVIHASQTGFHSGTFSYNSGTKTVTFNPDDDFEMGETVSVILTTGIQNITGNPIPTAYNWSFTIESFDGSGVFSSPISLDIDSVYTITAGDLDGDEDIDLILVNLYSPGSVIILKNDGEGTYPERQILDSEQNPRSVAIGDFDVDGDLDIVVTHSDYFGTILLFLNDGSGNFGQSSTTMIGQYIGLVISNDFDGDGDLDLALTYGDYIANNLNILVNDGTGNFDEGSSLGLEYLVSSLSTGDYDNDGDFDVAVSSTYPSGVSTFINDGNGNFSQGIWVSIGDNSNPQSIASGDLDADGDLDIAVANSQLNTISILTNDGSGAFTESATISTGNYPKSISADDYDGDGDLDLAVANYSSKTISILMNDGFGSFGQDSPITLNHNVNSVTGVDLEGDGDVDLAITQYNSSTNSYIAAVLFNRNSREDIELSSDSLNFHITKLYATRMLKFKIYNEGVDSTLYVTNIASSNYVFISNPTSATVFPGDSVTITVDFTPNEIITYTDSLTIVSSDPMYPQVKMYLSGVGYPVISHIPDQNALGVSEDTNISVTFGVDINASTVNANTFLVHASETGFRSGSYTYDSGTKTATFTPDSVFRHGEIVSVTLTTGIQTIIGDPLPYQYNWSFTTRADDGTALFLNIEYPNLGNNPYLIRTGDFDADGDLDMAVIFSSTTLAILKNEGGRNFTQSFTMGLGNWVNYIAVGDLDNDADLDLVVTKGDWYQTYEMSILVNDGNGSFSESQTLNYSNSLGSICPGDFDSDGDLDLVVAINSSPGIIKIFTNDGYGGFSETGTMYVDNYPYLITKGDWDGDGDLDLAVANSSSTGVLLFLTNNGSASFTQTGGASIGNNIQSITAGDFNGDNYLDMAITIYSLNAVKILTNDMTGNFIQTTALVGYGNYTRRVTNGDFNGDGNLDLAVSISTSPGIVHILKNDGNGSFTPTDTVDVADYPNYIYGGDFDGDGDLDLAVTGQSYLSILYNRDTKPFISISSNSLDFIQTKMFSTRSLEFKIYNEGIDSTLQVTNISSSDTVFAPIPTSASVSPGDSAIITVNFTPTDMGTYTDTLTIFSNDPNKPVVEIYVSGLGNPVVSHSPVQNALSVPVDTDISVTFGVDMNDSTINSNTFIVYGSQTGLLTGNYSYNVSERTAMFNPDDVFKAGENVSIMLLREIQTEDGVGITQPYNWTFIAKTSSGYGMFLNTGQIDVGNNPNSITTGDFNEDGYLDLALVRGSYPGILSILINDGYGSFAQTATVYVERNPRSITTGDFDLDGDLDLALANYYSSNTVSILINDGVGNFSQTAILGESLSWAKSITTCDLDGDGDLDLCVPYHDGSFIFFKNQGNGVFSSASVPYLGTYPSSIINGDLDGDGDVDLVIAKHSWNTVLIFENDGNGNLTEITSDPVIVADYPNSVIKGDFDQDSDLDLAFVGDSYPGILSILINDGYASFSNMATIEVGNNPTSISVGDFDSDGDIDLAVSNSNNVSILTNDGSSNFTETSTTAVGSNPISIAVGDFDNKGDLDLAVANQGSNNISILKNVPDLDIETSKDTLSFEIVKSNSSKELSFQIYNKGLFNQLNISDIVSSNPSVFSVVPTSGIIDTQDSLLVTVTFTPNEVITFFDSLTISSDDPDEPTAKVYLSGIGTPTVTSITPNRNSHNESENTDISATFSSDMASSSIHDTSFLAFGEISGKHSCVISYDSGTKTATLNPDSSFVFGEKVQVILTEDVKSNQDSISLADGYTWKFGVAPLFGSGDYSLDAVTYTTESAPFAIAVGNFDGSSHRFSKRRSEKTKQTRNPTIRGSFPREKMKRNIFSKRADRSQYKTNLKDFKKLEVSFSGYLSVDNKSKYAKIIGRQSTGSSYYPDFVVANSGDNSVSVFINDQNWGFNLSVTYNVGANPQGITVADIDADGDTDIIIANNSSNNVSILKNQGDGMFGIASDYSVGTGPRAIASADLDNDGHIDIVSVNVMGNNISILMNDGTGAFSSVIDIDVGTVPSELVLEDLDDDGDIDIAVSNKNSNNISVLLNSSGSFAVDSTYATGSGPNSIVAYDFDGDGDVDLATANGSSNNISILFNDGNGVLGSPTNFAAGSMPIDIYANDLDADGDIDLASLNFSSNDVTIFSNNGSGTFTATDTTGVGLGPRAITGLDISGVAGSIDLLTANLTGNNVSLLRNQIINNPPVRISQIGDVTYDEDSGEHVVVSDLNTIFADTIDNDPLIFSVVSSNQNILATIQNSISLVINSASDFFGQGEIIVTATDRVDAVSDTFIVTINNVNDTPVITTTELSDAIEDVAYADTVSATDVDIGDTLTYTLVTSPAWLSIESTSGALSGMPTNDDVGTNILIEVKVSDISGSTDTLTTTIEVINTNDPPEILTTELSNGYEESAYADTIIATDPDVGDTITFTALSIPVWMSLDTTDGTLSGTPLHTDVDSSVYISIRVMDIGELSDTLITTIAVFDTITPNPPQNLTSTPGNQQITLRWSANSESDLHKYNIYRDTSSTAITLIDSVVSSSPPDTFYIDMGLTNGTIYYYRITAVDSA